MTLSLRRLDSTVAGFETNLQALLLATPESDATVLATVDKVIGDIRKHGDAALLEYARRFDGVQVTQAGDLEIPLEQAQQALQNLVPELRNALQTAAERIRRYANEQKMASWMIEDEDGNRLGQQVRPLDRVGVYVPGGKASYPSTVLMNAIPATVAGVKDIIMTAPSAGAPINPLVLASAAIAGVTRIFNVGGAQAIAALAWGTDTVPAVDKIVGPGNAYVAAAKRQVFGKVGIDMIAGPSEILVIADDSANPDWVAMDLFSQAEHDEDAQSILISPSATLLDAVESAMNRLLESLPRREIIQQSLAARGALIHVADLAQATDIANRIAPEHLELAVRDPDALLPQIRHAGAIFLGHRTPESFGDYCAGPNHVLPTAGTARFSSPLGVYDFQKRSSVVDISAEGARRLSPVAARLAHGEGLQAHARAAEMRGEE